MAGLKGPSTNRTGPMSEKNCIIIGASHAGAQAATSLVQDGWDGGIILIGDEPVAPYQRPPLSKAFLDGSMSEEHLLIRPAESYTEHGIDIRLSTRVTKIDRSAKTVTTDKGDTLPYAKLILCTGADVRHIPVPGADLPGIHYLRTMADVEAIKADVAKAKTAAIVGGGYIGLEAAASLTKFGLNVTVIEAMDRCLQRVTAPEVSAFYTRIHTEEGVTILCNTKVSGFVGEDRVSGVDIGGTQVAADMVIVGIGVIPNVDLARDAGLKVENGITVDDHAATSDPDIFAVGDCSFHPSHTYGRMMRLESVQNAADQAKIAAANICGKDKTYDAVPWFWSDQFDLGLKIAGVSDGYDRVIVRGLPDKARDFVVWYLKDGKLIAADCINRPKEFMVARQVLGGMKRADIDRLGDDSVDAKALMLPL